MNEKATTSFLLREFPYEPTPGQQILIERLGRFITSSWENPNALFLLRGYAGTGKTTVVTALVNVLPELKKRFVLLAPTGRAAKVLASYTQKQANTIHRKIYFARTTKDGVIALKLQQNLHKNTLFIVDEASMIQNSSMNDFNLFNGRNLMDDLFYYVYSGENNKLLFIGDTAQLPPVGLDNSPALDPEFLKKSYAKIQLHILIAISIVHFQLTPYPTEFLSIQSFISSTNSCAYFSKASVFNTGI